MAPYRGRFAPSPTGLLHQGSLLAALASWLDARAHGGSWLIRMEDVDSPRVVPGAADAILATLARFGLTSDEPVLYQSGRRAAYHEALQRLVDAQLSYRCRCAREARSLPAPCLCRDLVVTDADSAWRLRLDDAAIVVDDLIQGRSSYDPRLLGDPILYRRDGLAAYQLAVAVDDAHQGISDVVRGADLLESTAWQIAILQALQLPVPRYAHIPLLTEPGGAKLAKSRRSVALAGLDERGTLAEALGLLDIALPEELKAAPVSDMLHWSVTHWSTARLSGIRAIALPN
ncbi:MAG TPA: tRNA glutamyl-Q(34) synthetase GluQRS [Steroidobacteraceae bacterium]|nr:tRNA glutamyl-Q(34) synthetase GluQRS [Steroidobacteraceae bacterium]